MLCSELLLSFSPLQPHFQYGVNTTTNIGRTCFFGRNRRPISVGMTGDITAHTKANVRQNTAHMVTYVT